MASAAPRARSDDRLSTPDPLDGDVINFDAWLLPPEVPHLAERMIRLASSVAGPTIFAAALVGMIHWLA